MIPSVDRVKQNHYRETTEEKRARFQHANIRGATRATNIALESMQKPPKPYNEFWEDKNHPLEGAPSFGPIRRDDPPPPNNDPDRQGLRIENGRIVCPVTKEECACCCCATITCMICWAICLPW